MSIPREGSRDTGQGIIISLSLDVCKTPVGSALVPIPYTITAIQGDDANTVATVRMTGQRAHHTASLVTQCSGDAPGTGMGVVSGTVGSVCHPKSHSGSVRIRGEWAIRHSDERWMNNRNRVGKLTYLKSQETFAPTPAIVDNNTPGSQVPPEYIQLADASQTWAEYLGFAQPEPATLPEVRIPGTTGTPPAPALAPAPPPPEDNRQRRPPAWGPWKLLWPLRIYHALEYITRPLRALSSTIPNTITNLDVAADSLGPALDSTLRDYADQLPAGYAEVASAVYAEAARVL